MCERKREKERCKHAVEYVVCVFVGVSDSVWICVCMCVQ